MLPMGYTKVGNTIYEMGSSGLEIDVLDTMSATHDPTSSAGAFSNSKTVTAQAGHDYILIANVKVYSTSSYASSWNTIPTLTITGAQLSSSYLLPTYSPGTSQSEYGTSFSLTDVVASSDTDQSITVTVSGRWGNSRNIGYYYSINIALIGLN